jgi:hypothetical protein
MECLRSIVLLVVTRRRKVSQLPERIPLPRKVRIEAIIFNFSHAYTNKYNMRDICVNNYLIYIYGMCTEGRQTFNIMHIGDARVDNRSTHMKAGSSTTNNLREVRSGRHLKKDGDWDDSSTWELDHNKREVLPLTRSCIHVILIFMNYSIGI